MTLEHFDMLIVGAGISGIGAAYHMGANCPTKTYAILEGREAMGGTWDLFRYPGIRSDSDMYTLGYSFKPWTNAKAIADGPSILSYLHETAREYDIERHIRYRHMVKRASWSSETASWTVDVEVGEAKELKQISCNFLFMCSGYYSYESGYTPVFPGAENFKGRIVHPQKWTEDIDYKGKRVIVIGSGATAVTLVPEMAKDAAHVTMLQRSPTYVVSRPDQDALANTFRKYLPSKVAYGLTRWKNVLFGMYFFRLARKKPKQVKDYILKMVGEHLGEDYVKKHFTPSYNPWDQRLCLVPNGDLFDAIKTDKADVVTDHIETFTEDGIRLKSGAELKADLIVTATGLNMKLLSGLEVTVDGKPVEFSKTFNYKGMMYSGVPNLASSFGYTNASWTLKCDLTCEYVCRIVNHMDKTGTRQATPVLNDPNIEAEPWLDFSSGYVQRAIDQFPRQGTKAPWKVYQNYALDLVSLKFGKVDDGTLVFSNKASAKKVEAPAKQNEAA
jgi:cation diffusion facilitator CzcD-associated flavoprotein CzcO